MQSNTVLQQLEKSYTRREGDPLLQFWVPDASSQCVFTPADTVRYENQIWERKWNHNDFVGMEAVPVCFHLPNFVATYFTRLTMSARDIHESYGKYRLKDPDLDSPLQYLRCNKTHHVYACTTLIPQIIGSWLGRIILEKFTIVVKVKSKFTSALYQLHSILLRSCAVRVHSKLLGNIHHYGRVDPYDGDDESTYFFSRKDTAWYGYDDTYALLREM